MKQKGLGDTVKAVLKAVGVDKECKPCQGRQETLNELVNYEKTVEIVDGFYKRYIRIKDR